MIGHGLGTTIWSPLASGILTGKYNNGIPKGSRLDQHEWLRDRLSEDNIKKVKDLTTVAKEIDSSMAQLAIAWCLKNPRVSTVILGASSLEQLDENLGALEVKERLNPTILKRIEEILQNKPE